jgi:hypothetical protein
VPEPLRPHTRYTLDCEPNYAALCEFLDGVAGVEPRPVGPRPPRTRRTGQPLTFPAGGGRREVSVGGDEVPREMPPGAEAFFGREPQREQLVARLSAGKNAAVVGPAGMGKTALAATAVADVVGENFERLDGGPFPDGVVFLDLYTLRAQAEAAWHALANKLAGVDFRELRPASERAIDACRGRRLLLIVEGGEEALRWPSCSACSTRRTTAGCC